MFKLLITENEGNQRLDRFLKKYLDKAPLSMIYKVIRKDLKVNGKRAKEDTILNVNDELTFYLLAEEVEKLKKEEKKIVKVKKQFKVAFEDSNLIIVEKPFGLLTHGDQNEKKNHLQNQVLDYLISKKEYIPRENKTFVISPSNRLDRNTTGLVIFAKNYKTLQGLNKIIQDKNSIEKKYMTIVYGKVEKPMILKGLMNKDEHNNLVVTNDSSGKYMETHINPIKSAVYKGNWYTMLDVQILTGRTHQIRVQLNEAGFPIIGDKKYGNPKVNKLISNDFNWNTQLLHAYKLVFKEIDDENLKYLEGKEIISSLPLEFSKIINKIFKD